MKVSGHDDVVRGHGGRENAGREGETRRWAATGPPAAQNAAGNPIREWPKADPAVTSGILDGDPHQDNQDALRA